MEPGLGFIRWWTGAVGCGYKELADSQQPPCYSRIGGCLSIVAKCGCITNSPQITVAYKTKVFPVVYVGCALAVVLHIFSHSATCLFYCG